MGARLGADRVFSSSRQNAAGLPIIERAQQRAGNPSGDAAGGKATGGAATGGSDNACENASDCAWGEINHEILTKADCVCLFGCPYLPQSRTTVERRRAQYTALCTPGQNGQGMPCPIDDCIEMPSLSCVNGACARP